MIHSALSDSSSWAVALWPPTVAGATPAIVTWASRPKSGFKPSSAQKSRGSGMTGYGQAIGWCTPGMTADDGEGQHSSRGSGDWAVLRPWMRQSEKVRFRIKKDSHHVE